MEPKINFWIEDEGKVTLSLWRTRLLAAVGEAGSISGGAEQMGIPYRVAWQKIHEMEERLGRKLVVTQVGGREGGGSRLTPLAMQLIESFAEIGRELDDLARMRAQNLLKDSPPD